MTNAVNSLDWRDVEPKVDVDEAEYKRLLGFPPGHRLEGRSRELADWARDWYAKHGHPWIFAHGAASLEIGGDTLRVNGAEFASRRLREQLGEAEARHAALVAVSAGPECEAHARELWQDEKPDEYFFLEIFGSAVVEHLILQTGARLCAWADDRKLAVLPHYSPGYSGWEMSDQGRLLSLLRNGRGFPSPLEALDSGMLRPKKSLIALFGLTDRLDLARSLVGLVPCENCSYAPCQYRRAPFRRHQPQLEDVRRLQPAESAGGSFALTRDARYSVNTRALHKWAEQRLELTFKPDGGVEAMFHYEGTTCSNLGRPLQYDYRVTLAPPGLGYRILGAECAPAPNDTGHAHQCEHLNRGVAFAASVASEKPLLNEPLEGVLAWKRSNSPAGCYCEASSRAHKWGLVYEVIHYALSRRETAFAK